MTRLIIACVCMLSLQPLLPVICVRAQSGGTAPSGNVDTSGLSESEKAARLTAAIPQAIKQYNPEGVATAERLVLRLDSLSSAVNLQKIAGHKDLLSYYSAVDNDSQTFRHASRILSIAQALGASGRRQAEEAILAAYSGLAKVYGDRADPERAIATLHRGMRTAGLPDAQKVLSPVLARYRQIGRRGAIIQAQRWFNAAPGTTRFVPGGGVTLIEFTAHWCGPCRKSYPAILRLQNKYGAKGVKTLLVTLTYGFFKKEKGVTPAQEASADSAYYLTEHALPAQVAVYETGQTATGAPAAMPNETNYHVSGIPQIVLLDRAGVVRMVIVGWDPASEARLDAMIGTVLAEPRAKGKTSAVR